MMYMTKKNANKREQIVFGCDYNPDRYRFGGVAYYEEMSLDAMKKLISEGFADPLETQNSSPSIQDFIDFVDSMKNHDNWYFHGYVVSPERDDARVSVEGIGSIDPVSSEDLVEFLKQNRFADEITASPDLPAYCWYD